jgi:hypothetical protein
MATRAAKSEAFPDVVKTVTSGLAKSEGVIDPPGLLREAFRAGLSPGACRIYREAV